MSVIINFTEDKPKDVEIVDAVANNDLKGVAIKTADRHLLFRIYGLNVIKVGKERFYYRPHVDPVTEETNIVWYELKRMPKSLMDIVSNFLIIKTVENSKIDKFLKLPRYEYHR